MKVLPGSLAAAALVSLGVLVVSGGCTQQAEPVPVRALAQSGRSAFVCLSAPGTQPGPGRPITDCTRSVAKTRDDYRIDNTGKTTLPHLYGLVTQTTHGEIAVIDLTTNEDAIVDQNESIPGANFLHVGAQPVDIVATEGGTAAFVSVAEIGREGLFALPSSMLRPGAVNRDDPSAGARPPLSLSSWPACALPAAPGDMLILADPPSSDAERSSCDSAYGMADTAAHPNGDLSLEGPGRRKLIVTLPDLGGIAVIDAQSLLDKPAGSFDACLIERWLPLEVELSAPVFPRPYPEDGACVNAAVPETKAQPSFTPRPAGLSFAAGKLYVADLDAPVIHVIDMPTPCEPVELPPLLPSSIEEPDRAVTTSRLAVAPELTPDFRRYLYAIDVDQGTTMVFDVTDNAQSSRRPLLRPDPQWNPFQVRDRLQFVGPAEDVIIISRDTPATFPTTGAAPNGTRCDPDPTLTVCTATSATCDPETLYRTAADLRSGAGPTRLRGMFAFLLLSTGQISIIDIDDYDARCRGPRQYLDLFGCPQQALASSEPFTTEPLTSDESSCNVVRPHTARSRAFVMSSDVSGRNEPGLALYPLLYDKDGTPIAIEDNNSLLMRATLPAPKRCHRDSDCHAPATCTDPGSGSTSCITTCSSDADCFFPKTCKDKDGAPSPKPPSPLPPGTVFFCQGGEDSEHLALAVASEVRSIDTATGLVADQVPRHTLLMNLEDPRVHVVDQAWAVAYEGILPSVSGKVAQLCLSGSAGSTEGCPASPPGMAGLYSPDGRFCVSGVQSEASVRARLQAEGNPDVDALAPDLADYAQITSDIIDESNVYWNDPEGQCTYQFCRSTFGLADTPTPFAARSLYVKEAYQDHLDVDPKPYVDAQGNVHRVQIEDIKCCFPSLVSFNVRPGKQWIVLGQASGFLHHVIEDPATGVCRDSCDPALSRRNGRVRMAPQGTLLKDGDPLAFINPMFRFSITEQTQACVNNTDCPGTACQGGRCVVPPQRDMRFLLTTQGGFRSLSITLSTTAALQPQAFVFVKSTNELAITDGSIEGLLMVSTEALSVSRQYF